MPKTKHDPEAVDAYLAGLPEGERATLQALRQLIREQVPGVTERISYGTAVIFATRHDLVGFASQPKHLSLFTMSPGLAASLKDEIGPAHKVSGATIHFSPDHPVPTALVRAILRARVDEQAAG